VIVPALDQEIQESNRVGSTGDGHQGGPLRELQGGEVGAKAIQEGHTKK
jgi:hypothetical protein